MTIWVDADACPGAIKEILFRSAKRTGLQLTLIANRTVRAPVADNIDSVVVAAGLDVADDEIVDRLADGDLVITSDIPLAAEAIEKGALALSPRGRLHTTENIKARLTMRDFMETLRASGIQSGGPPPMSTNDSAEFANQLDRLVTKLLRKRDRKRD